MVPASYFSLVGGAISVIMIIGGFYVVLSRMKAKEQGLDSASIQAITLVMFFPTLLLTSSTGLMEGEALSALLGVVAGYVFGKATS